MRGGTCLAWAISAVGFLIGIGTTGIDQWWLDGIITFSGWGLISSSRAWWREVNAPTTVIVIRVDEERR